LTKARAAFASVALVLASCAGGPSAYAIHFAAGERAETAGRHDEASRAFDSASRDPASAREKNHAAYLAALEMIRAGDVADGAKRLDVIARTRGEHAAEARWQLVELDLSTNRPEAKTELDDFLRAYPNDGVAYPALEARLRLARDAGGETEALAVLRALQPAVEKSESAPRVAYEIAESLAKLGKLEEARAAFVDVATKYPYPGEYFDDALYRASEIDETLSRVPDAIADLERMLSVIEYSTWPGTYIRPRFPDAAWRIAVLYRDKLGDKAKALAAFERYESAFPNATRRDEAMWQESKLLEESGDASGACSRLERLVRTQPDSRYVPCVSLRCTNIERPKESHAPRRCHAYITR
jgi:tetratricopeptide (TPR) repeat protein